MTLHSIPEGPRLQTAMAQRTGPLETGIATTVIPGYANPARALGSEIVGARDDGQEPSLVSAGAAVGLSRAGQPRVCFRIPQRVPRCFPRGGDHLPQYSGLRFLQQLADVEFVFAILDPSFLQTLRRDRRAAP